MTRKLFVRSDTKEIIESFYKRVGIDCNQKLKKVQYFDGLCGVTERKEATRKHSKSYTYDDMPRFNQKKKTPLMEIEFSSDLDSEALSQLFGQKITDKTKSIWIPKLERGLGEKAWISTTGIEHRYHIYVISKGRPSCITARALLKCGADFSIVVEPSEFDLYKEKWGSRVITGDFDTSTRSSIPVRNYVDSISIENKYWLMDDNIEDFNYLTDNKKYVVRTTAILAATENFIEQFSNVGQAGLNYYSFAKASEGVSPYYLNTRIYSCILMNKDVDCERENGLLWRGRYNEDTDLSLRILKAGHCTVLMNSFLAGKMTTQRVKGGNTDSVYVDNDERLRFAKSLELQHPDVVKVVRKFNRWHHKVDYRKFDQQLVMSKRMDKIDYGLKLIDGAR